MAGDPVGVLGTYPHGSSMLHFEVYRPGTRRNTRWYQGDSKPPALLDPRDYLEGRTIIKKGVNLAVPAFALAALAGFYYGLRR